MRGAGARPQPMKSGGCLDGLALRSYPDDVPGEAEPLQRPDHRRGGIELLALHAVHRRCREGVMAVVPGLAERRQGEPGEVSRLVGRLEVPLAEHVAERIDRVGDVVEDENPDRASPEQAGETGEHRAADGDAETERDCEPYRRPEQEGAIDEARDRVLEKVGRVALLVAALGVDEEPAEASVEEALELRPDD